MKMFYQQFLAFFLMITITLLTLGMTFLGLSRSMFYQHNWDRLQDYAYAVKTQAMDIRQGKDSKVVVDKKKLVIIKIFNTVHFKKKSINPKLCIYRAFIGFFIPFFGIFRRRSPPRRPVRRRCPPAWWRSPERSAPSPGERCLGCGGPQGRSAGRSGS